jgi:hypothetical protein
MRTRHLNGLLVLAIVLISTAPLYAQWLSSASTTRRSINSAMSKIDFDCDFVLYGSGVVLALPQTIEAGQWLGPNRFIDHRRAEYVMHLMMDDGFRVAVNGLFAPTIGRAAESSAPLSDAPTKAQKIRFTLALVYDIDRNVRRLIEDMDQEMARRVLDI